MTPVWQAFREGIIDRLCAIDPDRFEYIDRDRILGACASCRASAPAYVAVAFIGTTCTADLYCSAGCTPLQLAYAFDLPIVDNQHEAPTAESPLDERLVILRRRRERQLAAHGIGDYTTPGDTP